MTCIVLNQRNGKCWDRITIETLRAATLQEEGVPLFHLSLERMPVGVLHVCSVSQSGGPGAPGLTCLPQPCSQPLSTLLGILFGFQSKAQARPWSPPPPHLSPVPDCHGGTGYGLVCTGLSISPCRCPSDLPAHSSLPQALWAVHSRGSHGSPPPAG